VYLTFKGVGKTSLIKQFSECSFKEMHDPTIGVEFGDKIVSLNGIPLRI
jgi:GTPase SAR1 family protein